MEQLMAKKIKGPNGLREEAKKHGIKYASKMSKEEIIESLLKCRDHEFSRDDLVNTAKELGITGITKKRKEKLISEIRFKMTDTADRILHEFSYYQDKTDEELVKDMFCQSVATLKEYAKDNNLGFLYGFKKVNNMESLFVNIRSGCSVKLLENKPDDESNHEQFDNADAIMGIKSVINLIIEDDFRLLFSDHREAWNREQLHSLLTFLGGSERKVKRLDDEELLSLLIRLEHVTYYGRRNSSLFMGNVTRMDLRERFYEACEEVARQCFFTNANLVKNTKKGNRLKECMEERGYYFENGKWVSSEDDEYD